MSKEQTDLAACPLCNSAMAIEQFVGWDGEDLPVKHVTHPKSECPLSGLQFEARGEAIEAWNRRASPSPAGGVQAVTDEMSLREVLQKSHEQFAITIAFLGRDLGTDRMERTVGQLIEQLSAMDQTVIAALSSQAQTTGGERNAVIEECAKVAEKAAAAQSQFQKSAYDRGDDIGGHGHWKAQGELLNLATTLRALKSGAPDA